MQQTIPRPSRPHPAGTRSHTARRPTLRRMLRTGQRVSRLVAHGGRLPLRALVAVIVGSGCAQRQEAPEQIEEVPEQSGETERPEPGPTQVELIGGVAGAQLTYDCSAIAPRTSTQDDSNLVWDYAAWILRQARESGNLEAVKPIADASDSVSDELELAVVRYLCSGADIEPPDSQHMAAMVAYRDGLKRREEWEVERRLRAEQRRQQLDSITPVIDALEDSVATYPDDARLAQWLWRLGSLWLGHLGGYAAVSPYSVDGDTQETPALAERHPEYFRAHCCEAMYYYNYAHFLRLVRLFPRDTLADDAAYLITRLPFMGECEGQVACYISRDFDLVAGFLQAYPHSPYAEDAVVRANDAFTSVLTWRPEPHYMWDFDTTAVRALIASYDSTANGLPPALQAAVYQVIGPLWAGFGDTTRAQELHRLLVGDLIGFLDTLRFQTAWDSLAQLVREPPIRP